MFCSSCWRSLLWCEGLLVSVSSGDTSVHSESSTGPCRTQVIIHSTDWTHLTFEIIWDIKYGQVKGAWMRQTQLNRIFYEPKTKQVSVCSLQKHSFHLPDTYYILVLKYTFNCTRFSTIMKSILNDSILLILQHPTCSVPSLPPTPLFIACYITAAKENWFNCISVSFIKCKHGFNGFIKSLIYSVCAQRSFEELLSLL